MLLRKLALVITLRLILDATCNIRLNRRHSKLTCATASITTKSVKTCSGRSNRSTCMRLHTETSSSAPSCGRDVTNALSLATTPRPRYPCLSFIKSRLYSNLVRLLMFLICGRLRGYANHRAMACLRIALILRSLDRFNARFIKSLFIYSALVCVFLKLMIHFRSFIAIDRLVASNKILMVQLLLFVAKVALGTRLIVNTCAVPANSRAARRSLSLC